MSDFDEIGEEPIENTPATPKNGRGRKVKSNTNGEKSQAQGKSDLKLVADARAAAEAEAKTPTIIPSVPGAPGPDPDDLEAAVVDQTYLNKAGSDKTPQPTKIRKPGKDFFRAFPYYRHFNLYADEVEGKIDKNFYFVMPQMAATMEGETYTAAMVLCVNSSGIQFFWPIRQQVEGDDNKWTTSTWTAVKLAIEKWIKIRPNQKRGAGYYDSFAAKGELGEPEFTVNDEAGLHGTPQSCHTRGTQDQSQRSPYRGQGRRSKDREGGRKLAVIDLPYREIWLADFEFRQPDGERPEPACLVALEMRTGRKIRLWRDQFGPAPPYPIDANSLFVCYFASAEMSCHRVLGWPMPRRVLDLFTEFRDLTNGLRGIDGHFQKASILDALAYFGLGHIAHSEKASMRNKFISGKDFDAWTPAEREEGLDYCETDVVALAGLLPAMLPTLDLRHALLRGRYSGPAVSAMQHEAIPIDVPLLRFVQDNWTAIIDELIARIDTGYGVYDGRVFKEHRFEAYLAEHRIPWERTEHGHLKLDDDTFADMVKVHRGLEPLRNLRHSLGTMRLNNLAIGQDGRNRTLLSQFASRTGRNQPSSARFVFGPGVWLRGFVKPLPGMAVAYVDWVAAEFGIVAKLSEDPLMMAAYLTGDPHLAFAKQAGAVPDDATKESHEAQRERYKTVNFGILYGMGLVALAKRISGDNNDPEVRPRSYSPTISVSISATGNGAS